MARCGRRRATLPLPRARHDHISRPPHQHRAAGIVRFASNRGPEIFLTTASYDIFKENLLRYDIVGDNPACHFLASFGAGTFATTISQPADVVRSRLMATHGGNVRILPPVLLRGPNDHVQTNPIAITKQLVAQGGLRSLFKGWVPAWYRQTPQTILVSAARPQQRF
jgi:hypothetical protein